MIKSMSSTPYFDAYEKYRKNKLNNELNLNIGIKKIFTTINGQSVLKDIEFNVSDEFEIRPKVYKINGLCTEFSFDDYLTQ